MSLVLKTFLIITGIFFPIFWYFCLLWTERETKNLRNIFGAFVVALLYVFKIILLGSFLIFLFSVIMQLV